MVINENNLSMMDPDAQKYLKEQMDKFFFSEEGADDVQGYTPKS
jgi:Fe-S cluster biosynthesis and repair protein YggX